MQDSIRLLDEALEWLGTGYSGFLFYVERDVTWTLQSYLVRRIRELDMPFVVGSSERPAADITLSHEGEIVLAVSVKYEPSGSYNVSWKNDVVRNARQFNKLVLSGKFKAAAVVVVDEGRHLRDETETLETGEWVDWPDSVSIFRYASDGKGSPVLKQRLAEIAAVLAVKTKPGLEERKNRETADLCRPDFLWWRLVHDILVQGNSDAGVGPEKIEGMYGQLKYDVFLQLTAEERFGYANQQLADGGIRMARKKAQWLVQNFGVIEGMGGPIAAKERLLSCSGRTGKIRFLKTFSGVGDHGARSIMMAAYHEEFRNSIAIDEPINRITTQLGLSFRSYAEQESFLLEVAALCGLEGWELDRILSEHYKPALAEITPSLCMAARR